MSEKLDKGKPGLAADGGFFSIVIPAFNEEDNIELIYKRIVSVMADNCFEILFVDDGSADGTLEEIECLARMDHRVKYISFSRNFGHQKALKAGLDRAGGDCAISLDADLQHPPEFIPTMISAWRDGYEIICAYRQYDTNIPFFKKIMSTLFYKLLNFLSPVKIHSDAADFRLLDRKVLDVFRQIHEQHLFLRGIVSWMGFRQCYIPYIQEKRTHGQTKYSIRKMVHLAFDGVTSFSVRPLHLSTLFGTIISLTAFLYAFFALWASVFSDKVISGWTSMILSVLFLGGIQLLMLGIIGEYLGKLFVESKNRPNYIVRKTNIN
jgi:polyisoprenyl-phosphate glycosyltransferase